jgi:solute carrier family 25 (mitochondrial aspartate/glutamate transporter), member 12/13
MEIIKVRLQVGQRAGSNGSESIVSMLRELGIRGMYRGASACFLRDMPFSGLYFPIYSALKHRLSMYHAEPGATAPDLLVAGTIAGRLIQYALVQPALPID